LSVRTPEIVPLFCAIEIVQINSAINRNLKLNFISVLCLIYFCAKKEPRCKVHVTDLLCFCVVKIIKLLPD